MAEMEICIRGTFDRSDFPLRPIDFGESLPDDLRIGDWIFYDLQYFTVAKKVVIPGARGYTVLYKVWRPRKEEEG